MLSLFRSRSPVPPAVTALPTDALDAALKSFQDCLDPEQKAKLETIKAVPDAHAVAEFTHQLDQENAKRKSRCVAARISPLLESIQQFSGAVETFVSSHPQVAALIWGSVKLVLQIASNFTTYFDKLSALLMTIGKRCPRFQEYQSLYGGSTDLQKALCDFYSVVVRCCEQAVITIRQTGYVQLLKAMTGSFNSEFEPLLIQINSSSNEVNETIRLVEAKLSTSERKYQRSERDEAQKYRLESSIHRQERLKIEAARSEQMQLERWKIQQASELEQLSNFDNRTAYWKARTQRHGSTGQWLTQTDQFVQWIAESSSSVLWCTGNLGSGKTVMTGYVVELLSAQCSQSTEKLVYFFCQYDNQTSLQATTILKSIVRQLLDYDDEVFRANQWKIDKVLEHPDGLGSIEYLLFSIIGSLKSVVVVLDGVDECSRVEMKSLFKTFRRLMDQYPSGVKLFLAGDSCISDLVISFLDPNFVVNTHMPEAGSDLEELIQQLVSARTEDGDLVAGDPALYQEIVDALCAASQGMILWVKFQLEELCTQKTDESIRLTLKHLPKDIFETYNRLISRIVEEGSVETCNRIFRYMAAAKRPLTLDELGEAISLEPCQPYFMPERLINSPKGIIRWCHGLIALHDLDDTLQFAHSSVKDFLCNPEAARVTLQDFHFAQNDADRRLGEVCVTYLSFNDFKIQLVKAPKAQVFLDPMMMASHALNARSTGIVLKKAKHLMGKRSKSTPVTSRLMTSQTVTKPYWFLQYASDFWLTHTKEFSPGQGRVWTLFVPLAEERFTILSDPGDPSQSLRNPRATELCYYMFGNQHLALFRHCMARQSDLTLTLAWVLRFKYLSFIRLIPELTEQPKSSWIEAVLSVGVPDIHDFLSHAGTDWMEGLTLIERSTLLAKFITDGDSDASWKLVQLGIDPLHNCNDQGLTTTLFEKLIRYGGPGHLEHVCQAMLASNAIFERKIAHPGRTALHVAALYNRHEAIKVLLKHGALVDVTDDHRQTALHIAAWLNSLPTVKTLLAAGASLELRDKDFRTALDYAEQEVAHQLHLVMASRPDGTSRSK